MTPKALRPAVHLDADALRIDLPPLGSAASLRRTIEVPYSSILVAGPGEGKLPGVLTFRVGTHLPGRFAYGTFWGGGPKRFVYFTKGDSTLQIDLERHAFSRIEIAVDDPEAIAAEIRRRVGRPGAPIRGLHDK